MHAWKIFAAAGLLSLGLAGCVDPQPTITPDFGASVHENLTAQIADPEPHYKGLPAPGSDGHRVGLAQQRYVTGKVIKPTPAAGYVVGANNSADSGNGGDQGGGSGAGADSGSPK